MSLLNLFGDDADFFGGKTPESRARGAGQIAYESIPLISEAVTYRDIKNELSKKNPNWGVIAMLGGAGLLGLVPLIGDALGTTARKVIKKGNKVELTLEEQNAQKIIDLLKSGENDKVTDYLMANADEKYLFENYDLPMDFESRMKRAKEMGYDENTYHGTLHNSYKAPDSDKIKIPSSVLDLFTSSNPDVAQTYGDVVYPLMTSSKDKTWTIDAKGKNWNKLHVEDDVIPEGLMDFWKDEGGISTNELVSFVNEGDKYVWKDHLGVPEEIIDMNKGFQKVKFENIVDRGSNFPKNLKNNKKINKPHNVTVNLANRDSRLRSKFARFDPRLKHLKHISAGIPIGLLPFIDMEKLLEEKEVKDD